MTMFISRHQFDAGTKLTIPFSRRTETDLYVMLTEHREELEDELGLTIDSETAAVEWADQQREEAQSPVIRLGKRLRDAVIPNNLEDGPEPGLWRQTFRKHNGCSAPSSLHSKASRQMNKHWHMP